MACHVCGRQGTEFSVSRKSAVTGEQEVLAYCEPCFVAEFGREPAVADILKQRRIVAYEHFARKLDQDMERLRASFDPGYEKLRAQCPRFAREAYLVVFRALALATWQEGKPYQSGQCGRHANAAEVVAACQKLARQTWAEKAQPHLAGLGITSASDIGDIVYLLIENRLMGANEGDRRSDFDGLPFFA